MEERMWKHLINTVRDIESVINTKDCTDEEKVLNIRTILLLIHGVDIDKVI